MWFHASWTCLGVEATDHDIRREIVSVNDGRDIQFTLVEPRAQDAWGMPVPPRARRTLFVYLHGWGGDFRRFELPGKPGVRRWFARNALVLVPYAQDRSWWFLNYGRGEDLTPWATAPWDHALSAAYCGLVSQAVECLPVWPKAILAGCSMGGNGAWMLAAERPELFGALVAVASDIREEFHEEIAAKLAHVPVLCIHCKGDQACPFSEIERMCQATRRVKAAAAAEEELRTVFLAQDWIYGAEFHDYWHVFFNNITLLKWCFEQVASHCAAPADVESDVVPMQEGKEAGQEESVAKADESSHSQADLAGAWGVEAWHSRPGRKHCGGHSQGWGPGSWQQARSWGRVSGGSRDHWWSGRSCAHVHARDHHWRHEGFHRRGWSRAGHGGWGGGRW
eukprot:NODE_10738_length_1332_cov_7.141079.p1 GENE.NODE_10738_length_1332_cov_7.141079~~NODE_10738_length_1332_cov_7.141079.p1  ORF type:complete len:410 (+),score=86.41 NODE_10738_length_1332_cov_7.141079:50-1231(+)